MTTAARPARRPRPTPHPRPAPALELHAVVDAGTARPADTAEEVRAVVPVADPTELVQAADAQALAAVTATATELPAAHDAPAADDRQRPGTRVRLPRRRAVCYLLAALVGAMGLGTSTAGNGVAQADGPVPVSHSVSVAEELGIAGDATSTDLRAATIRSDAALLLGEVTASRTAREAEEAAAVQAQAEADRVAAEAAAAAAAEAARPRTVLPVNGARLTSGFGARWGSVHAGIDLAAPIGTPEYAAADGVVLEAGPASGYGNVVYIQHENGDVTVYGHMEEILVQPGQVVRAGDTIALLGNRGQSTGPHLHFEVHVGGIGGEKIDPLPWLRDRGVAI
ncbi:M23 family metallopeptidase [Geodermatophilus telluris]|uniref:M23 family metallopeptidase n=1 Tax=Geodermatophilus telluris TaxID=1190417 RepID=UPI001FE20DC6|nr:M23 family metallopeptidase [Geodermatophilus telluris]